MSRDPVRVGVIGAGTISKEYLTNLTAFPDLNVVAIGDLFPETAAARAQEFGVPQHGDTATVLENPDVELVVNLTIPAAHREISSAVILGGKHVWTEKPITTSREDGKALVDLAAERGVLLGGAPDTVLGPGYQSALRLLSDGEIGDIASALAVFQYPGPDSWHPNPAFLFQAGAGPIYDIGPYYLTALALAMGPMTRAYATGSRARTVRTIGSGPKAGETFDVTVPTQVTVILEFASGANATCLLSFDSPHTRVGMVEFSGLDGTLSLPDPNKFDGEIRTCAPGGDWVTRAETSSQASRGLGALDMARSLRAGVPHRLQGDLALHVLDAMVAIEESVLRREPVEFSTGFEPTAPVDSAWNPYEATL